MKLHISMTSYTNVSHKLFYIDERLIPILTIKVKQLVLAYTKEPMKAILGKDFFQLKSGKNTNIVLDTETLVNGHLFAIGGSGMGKSYTLINLAEQLADNKINPKKVIMHVFDVHGDLNIKGAQTIKFSEQSPYGLMPFKVSPNLESGGVRKCIQAFLMTIDQVSRTKLGLIQENVLRNLIEDMFLEFGIDRHDPSTWGVNEYGDPSLLISSGRDGRLYLEVPFEEKDKAYAFGARFDGDKKKWYIPFNKYQGELLKWKPAFKPRRYPTVKDLADYAQRIYQEKFLGSDQKAVRALEHFSKKSQAHKKKLIEAIKRQEITGYKEGSLDEELESAKQSALEAYEHYLDAAANGTGHEFESLLKYDNPTTLRSIATRLNNLYETGIFKSEEANFDEDTRIRRYYLKDLGYDEKKLFVLFTLRDIFNRAVQRGEQSDVVEVIMLDEVGTYTSSADEDGEGIIGVIAREARKYGLALWAASQTMDAIPNSLITSSAIKLVIGIDETQWKTVVPKLGLDQKLMEWITPHKSMAVQFKQKKQQKNRWWWVEF